MISVFFSGRRFFRHARNILLLPGLLVSLVAQSATSPDPADQEFQRQQERQQQLRQEMEAVPDVRLQRVQPATPDTAIPEMETPCFRISEIRLEGDAAAQFEFALKDVRSPESGIIGGCLGAQGINAVMARVQNAILAQGYVTTRILAAPQDLKAGRLVLTVIPGRIRAIRLTEDSGPRAHFWNALPMQPGDLLNLRDIEQGLENLKRVPTAEADIRIEPAQGADARPGESDLVIQYRQAFPLRLSLSADDGGSRSTGQYQAAVTLSADHLFTLNDLFYYSRNHDLGGGDTGERGTQGYTLHYEVPYGYWLLGLTESKSRYWQSVAGLNQNYLYSGDSRQQEIKLSRLVYRDAARKTTLSLAGYLKTSRNYIDDTEVLVQRRRMAGWQAGIAHREFIRTATLDLGLAYRHGTGMLEALPAPEENFHEGTARPRILTADAGLTLPFAVAGHSLRYSGTVRAQWNDTPLIPQDRFSIGGRYTVRGFDGEITLSAERGWLIRNELGLPLGQAGQELYLGVDYGHVDGPAAEFLIGRALAGAVAGLRGGYKQLSWDVFAGGALHKPDGFEPAGGVAGFNLNLTF